MATGEGDGRWVAHTPQNLSHGGLSNPQAGQRLLRGAAHSLQNFILSGSSNPKSGQHTGASSCTPVQVAVARGQDPRRASETRVSDRVSVLHAAHIVKRKARDSSRRYSDATKDSGVFLDVDTTQDLGFPESKNRDYFLGSL
jgi:hypothetical protein